MNTRHQIRTSRRCEMVDITAAVAAVVAESGVQVGLCTVYSVHTTAGVTVNEGADPDVCADILARLERLAPPDAGYLHTEGNSDAHIKTALVGPSAAVPIDGGNLALGTWQRIFFCEFDGPRNRTVLISVVSAK